jgi:MYXO-CTERM domain-containing protein
VDVASAYPFFGGYRVDLWSTHENAAGAPVHTFLALVGLAAAAVRWRRRGTLARTYVVGLAAALLVLAATVRWQPYNARLHVPLFVVGAAGMAATVHALGPVAARGATVALVLACLPASIANATRPLWAPAALVMSGVSSILTTPRDEQYFASRRVVQPAFARVAATVPRLACRTVRVKTGYDGWEYPLWPLLAARRLDHAFVENASTEIGERPLAPGSCLIVVDERPGWQPPPNPAALTLEWTEGRIAVWKARE